MQDTDLLRSLNVWAKILIKVLLLPNRALSVTTVSFLHDDLTS